MAVKKLFRKIRSAAGAPGRVIGGAYYDSKVRASKRKSDQIVDDVKTLRGMRQSERDNPGMKINGGSLQDPNSRVRRQMRVDDFKEEMSKPKKKRLFRRN